MTITNHSLMIEFTTSLSAFIACIGYTENEKKPNKSAINLLKTLQNCS